MTVRLVGAQVPCLLLLTTLVACSGDAPPDAGSATSTIHRTASQETATDGQSASRNLEAAGADHRGPNRDGLDLDEFGAAPPLSDDQMPPLESPGDRKVERSFVSTDLLRARVGEEDDEEDPLDLFAGAATQFERDRPNPESDPLEEIFAVARERDDDAQFAAAPPVPITDAAAPIPGEQEVAPTADEPGEPPYWPRFHGPQGDNKSPDTGLLQAWPEDGPPQVWSVSGIGYGYSSITTANGLIYTAGNKDDKTMVSAIDLDGNLRWQVGNGGAWTESFEGTRGTPTIDGDRLYHQSPLGDLVCLKAPSGDILWGLNSLRGFGGENITWALSESLLVDGDHVICCPGGSEASMVALNKMNGAAVWTAEPTGDKPGYSTPTLAEYDGLRMIFVMTSKAVIAVNADTGRLLFRHPFATQYDVNVLKPIFYEGHLFVSGGYGTTGSQLLKVNVAGEEVSVEVVWTSKDLDNHHGGVLLIEGCLYGAAHKFSNQKWVCLDWQTGQTKWTERGIGKGSLTYADGMLYLLSEKKLVGLAEPSPAGHEVISQFRLPAGGTGSSWAHPVVCGGRLYLRHADRLFAFDVKSRG